MFVGKSISYMLAASLLAFSTVASSGQDATWYAGAGVGTADMALGILTPSGAEALDDSVTGFKLFVGRKKEIAGVPGVGSVGLEGFYVNFGEATLNGNNGDSFNYNGTGYSFTANNVSIKAEGQAFGVGGVLFFPVTDQASIHTKIGLARWDFKATPSAPAVGNFSLDEAGVDFYFTIGASYQLGKNFAIGFDYERYTLSNNLSSADLLSGTLQYLF